ncbi:hypothetical protein [Curtobacterium sp. MCBA15_004]|uniref:hypothetical protein n=1 Tax=Curtobacterium sp. MCBA15_004 TaxID=1898733 RepID=UPI0008DC6F21|nr:hypothetical protein [Curtobacterium sp. MCBA15_004]WIA96435.1 hypothetical protein QOL16_15255 [Curtobacterium sp. MCBA15_004]
MAEPTGLPQPMNLTKAEQESFLAAMQDQQPTVQVPVSLIEALLGNAEPSRRMAARREVRALLSQPTPAEVEVEGSFFAVADLPAILARHMRALDEANRREKQHWIEQHEQPTPAAEPMSGLDAKIDALGLRDSDEPARPDSLLFPHAKADRMLAEPPRIEDMAPGTLFWAKDGKGVWRRLSKTNASVTSVVDLSTGRHFPAIHIDPSTIRDVTPPAVTE